jgi:hypothetical protein
MRSRAICAAVGVGRAHVRKLAGLTTMILVALLLAACGSDADNGDATEVATTVADIATEATTAEATETPTVDVTSETGIVSPLGESSPAATAVPGGMATPAELTPSALGTPAAAGTPSASPVAATPVTDTTIAPIGASDDADATPAAAEVSLTGQVVLSGVANEAWVMTNEGCVGLGDNASLQPGQQLVVRDAEGAIVGVTMLAASDENDACSWDFSLAVPESPFYAVSIPMAVEHVFTRQEVEQSDGEIVVPAT